MIRLLSAAHQGPGREKHLYYGVHKYLLNMVFLCQTQVLVLIARVKLLYKI